MLPFSVYYLEVEKVKLNLHGSIFMIWSVFLITSSKLLLCSQNELKIEHDLVYMNVEKHFFSIACIKSVYLKRNGRKEIVNYALI